MLKVVLVDDHVLLRNALAKIIHHFEGYSFYLRQ
jgi:DNA-binding NarL/FixJ family response regulator